jgi:hypothetical protein
MTAREAALHIAALYGWAPTTDPAQMGTIPEKSAWDVVHSVENIVERYRNASPTASGIGAEHTDVTAAQGSAQVVEYACCCNGEGRCGYCHEEAVCRAEFRGDAREERGR